LLLLGLVGGITLLLVFGWSLMIVDSHRQAMREGKAQGASSALLIEEHAKRTVEAANLALLHMADAYSDAADLPPARQQALLKQEARVADYMMSAMGSLAVVDRDGVVIASSLDHYETPPAEIIRSREYFASAAAGETVKVGRMVQSLVTGKLIFTVSRRLEDAKGNFAGVAVANIYVEYFTKLYQPETSHSGMMRAIFRDDGAVLVRTGVGAEAMGMDVGDTELFRTYLPKASSGSFIGTMPFDGRERLVSYRRVDGLPLVICVSIPLTEVLEMWWGNLRQGGFVLAVCLLSLALLTSLAWRRMRDEETARRELAVANHILEQRVHQRTTELEATRDEAVRATLAKTKFLAAASHDLRQPVQAMKTFQYILENAVAEPKLIRVVTEMGNAITSLEGLLDRLMNAQSLEVAAVKVEASVFPVSSVLRRVASQIDPLAREKGLGFRLIDCSSLIRSDPVLLERILRNLTVNAVRYTRRGRILLGCRRRKGRLFIEVWDTGPGIPTEMLDEVFKEFVSLDVAGHAAPTPGHGKGGEGVGLGLSIVSHAASLLGHKVHVQSSLGKGSCFSIELPLDPGEPRLL
jgi:signal transduction histidine kinase